MRHKLSSWSSWKTDLKVIVVVFIVLLLGEWLEINQSLRSVGETITNPSVIIANQLIIKISQPFFVLKKSFQAAQRLQKLELKYNQLLAHVSDLEYLEKENQELRHLLDFKKRSPSLVVATPITSHGQPSIGAGLDEGINVGQPVLAAESLLGVIKAVSNHQATITLLAQNSQQPILVVTQSGVEGLLMGDGKNLVLTEIPREAEISSGDRIMTVGQSKIPPRIFVGQIQQVIDRPSAPVKKAIVVQDVSFYEVAAVEVLL